MKKKKSDHLTRGLGVLVLLSLVFNWDTFVFLFADLNPIWPKVLLLIIGLCGLLSGILLLRLQIFGFFLFYVYLFCGLIFFSIGIVPLPPFASDFIPITIVIILNIILNFSLAIAAGFLHWNRRKL